MPVVTASDRSFPPVLARTWHGCGYPRWMLTPGPGVVGRHGPLAPSFRSQVPTPTASAAVCLTWKRSSVSVCWRPPQAVAIVTHLVAQALVYARTPGRPNANLNNVNFIIKHHDSLGTGARRGG
jgi:hypothetical protein